MNFIIYSIVTGKIRQSCSASSIQEVKAILSSDETENVIEGTGNSSTHYVLDQVLVEKPPKPSDHHTFNYSTKEWELDLQTVLLSAKKKRTTLLAQSDWTQLPDVPLATKEAWAIYRQALRDITDQPGYPVKIVWPLSPFDEITLADSPST